MTFQPYSSNILKSCPQTCWLGEYKVEFLFIESAGNEHKPPVMFLGGAFQSFQSFKGEVEEIIRSNRVILADFPSQGSNDQLAPDLEMDDYGKLIDEFLDYHDIDNVSLMGVSYGSVMATLFAANYPNRINKLLISGITCFKRNSLILLLEDSLALLESGDMHGFATTAVCNLINHNRMEETAVGSTYRKLLFRQIARLDNNERQRYAQNTRRLLRFDGLTSFPQCPTMIATGEYDNFTLPQENAQVAKQCDGATFAVIRNADHLAQFEQKQTVVKLVSDFFTSEHNSMNVDGIDFYSPHSYITKNARLQPRFYPLQQPYVLTDTKNQKSYEVRIRNINFSGCELEFLHTDLSLDVNSNELEISIPETNASYTIRILERDRMRLRCLIIQRDLKSADSLLRYLNEHILVLRENQKALNKSSQIA